MGRKIDTARAAAEEYRRTERDERLIDVDLGTLCGYIRDIVRTEVAALGEELRASAVPAREPAQGIMRLAEIIGCGKTKAQRLKSSGIFGDAIIQEGRTIRIDEAKVLAVLRSRQPVVKVKAGGAGLRQTVVNQAKI
jgi:hypothetical protein